MEDVGVEGCYDNVEIAKQALVQMLDYESGGHLQESLSNGTAFVSDDYLRGYIALGTEGDRFYVAISKVQTAMPYNLVYAQIDTKNVELDIVGYSDFNTAYDAMLKTMNIKANTQGIINKDYINVDITPLGKRGLQENSFFDLTEDSGYVCIKGGQLRWIGEVHQGYGC